MGTFSHSRMTRIGWGVFGSQLSQFLPSCSIFQIMNSVLLMVNMLTVGSTQQEVSKNILLSVVECEKNLVQAEQHCSRVGTWLANNSTSRSFIEERHHLT